MKKEQTDNVRMDIEKVEKLKKAIKDGTFKVDSKAIANKFINEVGIQYLLKTKKEMH